MEIISSEESKKCQLFRNIQSEFVIICYKDERKTVPLIYGGLLIDAETP
jgi:hypothetical protein